MANNNNDNSTNNYCCKVVTSQAVASQLHFTPFLIKNCQLTFCSMSVEYELISVKF